MHKVQALRHFLLNGLESLLMRLHPSSICFFSCQCIEGCSRFSKVIMLLLKEREDEEKKYCAGSKTTPYIYSGNGDTLARRAVSLLHQGKRRTSEDLKGGKPPPAPDQNLEISCFSKSASRVQKAQSEHVI